ncbi:MAG: ankyrin repeat domain-containing protein [Phycisphaerales bacterium]|nr:ankyrin repeat domain-containing protein [Phycisphaerales bacterium]
MLTLTSRHRHSRTAAMLRTAFLIALPYFTVGCSEDEHHGPAPAISLDAALIEGNDHAVRDHIIAGTPVNTPNAAGDTPLSVAAVLGRTYAAEVLIDAGAELEHRNNSGTTPLFNAAFFCHPEIVRVLIDAGADTGTTDASGTPIRQVMEVPWEQIEPIYAAVYGAIGIPLDASRIQSMRPQIAAMLR